MRTIRAERPYWPHAPNGFTVTTPTTSGESIDE